MEIQEMTKKLASNFPTPFSASAFYPDSVVTKKDIENCDYYIEFGNCKYAYDHSSGIAYFTSHDGYGEVSNSVYIDSFDAAVNDFNN